MEKYCSHCGRALKPDALFCDSCGEKLRKSALNTAQRRILIAVAVLITGIMLYPPYYFLRDPDTHTAARHDYDWLVGSGWGRVEVELLLIQILVVVILSAIAYFLCADKNH